MCSIFKKIVDIIQIVGPLLAILSLSITIGKAVIDGEMDDKKTKAKIKNTIMALIILFLIPLSINLILSNIGGNISTCWNGDKLSPGSSGYQKTEADKKEKKQQTGDYEKGIKMNNCKRKKDVVIKGEFSEKTYRIIKEHADDFNHTNFKYVVGDYKSTGRYVRSLGGIFQKHWGVKTRVRKASELREVSEYVFGLMTIYGFDYWNAITYCKWGGVCNSSEQYSCDAYYIDSYEDRYPLISGPLDDFDRLLANGHMLTNCNWTVDMVFYKAGLGGGAASCTNANYIQNTSDLQVGDYIHFFKKKPDFEHLENCAQDYEWTHVAYVGEVYDDHIVAYDGGSYFTSTRNYKWSASKGISWDQGLHGYSYWFGERRYNLIQD